MAEINLTIYKIKPKLEAVRIIKKIRDRQYFRFQVEDIAFDVYAKTRNDHPPSWEVFFEGRLPAGFSWDADGPGIVLLVNVNDLTFAITFGFGRHLLDPNAFEDHFGRKVVINCVKSVRSVNKKTFDAILGQTITQAAFDTDIGEFGVNIEKEVLRGVAGTPSDEQLGSKMSGIDALAVAVDTNLTRLPALLSRYDEIAKSKRYIDLGFEFVDHMSAVSSTELIDFLNSLLIEELASISEKVRRNLTYSTEFYFTVPDVVDFGITNSFAYSLSSSRSPKHSDVSLTDFLAYCNSIGQELNIEGIKHRKVYGFDGSGNQTETWTAFRCLVGSIPFDKARFVLSDGHWYRISEDYLGILDEDIKKIPLYGVSLPLYDGGKEDEYCGKVARSCPDLHYFNTDWVRPYSNQKYEFCDLYTEIDGYRDSIHVKRGISIGPLSHMLSQGKVSCDAYYGFEECRNQVEVKIETALGSAAYARGDRPTELRTVYAIISDRGNYLTFFSKVNLRSACAELKSANRRYALAWIGFDPSYRKLVK